MISPSDVQKVPPSLSGVTPHRTTFTNSRLIVGHFFVLSYNHEVELLQVFRSSTEWSAGC